MRMFLPYSVPLGIYTHSPRYHPHKILIRQGFTQRDYDYYVVLQHLTYSLLLLLYLICYTYTFLSTLHGQYQPNPMYTVDMYVHDTSNMNEGKVIKRKE